MNDQVKKPDLDIGRSDVDTNVRSEDVNRFFEVQGVNTVCQACGHNHDVLIATLDKNKSLTIPIMYSREVAQYGHQVFALACSHCGNIRMHMLYGFNQWLKDNPE